MPVSPIPKGFHTISPYMAVKDPAGLVEFLKKAFDARVEVHTMPDGTIYNAMAQVGDSMVLIGQVPKHLPDNELRPAMLYLYVEDVDTWYGKAVAAGARSIREPEDQWYGDRVGAVCDLANNQWWFATHKEDMAPEEMAKRARTQKQPS